MQQNLGHMLDSVYLHANRVSRSGDAVAGSQEQVEEAIEHWREPDRGIWEVRGEPQHSLEQVMCWVALIAARNWPNCRARRVRQQWRRSEEIKADILANGVDARGALTQRYGHDALDARCCSSPSAVPAITIRACAPRCCDRRQLTEDGLVLRYRTEETETATGRRGSFTICSFWLVWRWWRSVRSADQAPLRATAVVRQPLHSTRGNRAAHRTPPRNFLSVHPPGADQRRGARDPRRGGGRQHGVFQLPTHRPSG